MRLSRRTPSDGSADQGVGVLTSPVLTAAPSATLPAAPGLEERFRSFYIRLHPRALVFACRFASRADAEDAVQDAIMALWIRWRQRGPEPLDDHYFLALVRNKVSDRRRAERRMVSLDDAEVQLDALAFHAAPPYPTRGETRADVLDLAVAALPPKRREVFVLAQEQEYTYKEVGAVMRVSEDTVKTHLRLAMADVREAFVSAGHIYAARGAARLRTPAPTDQQPDTGAPDHV
jgi:RNA polymerase sigma factor (sigma-70 family)